VLSDSGLGVRPGAGVPRSTCRGGGGRKHCHWEQCCVLPKEVSCRTPRYKEAQVLAALQEQNQASVEGLWAPESIVS